MQKGLYKSKAIQYHNEIPFQTVDVVSFNDFIVDFQTEHPIRKLTCSREYFELHFRKIK